jgi:flagellar basal-body rod protein FlgF
MNVSLYQAAAALNVNSRWQELTATNLAASSIPGYKRQEMSFSAVQANLLDSTSGSGHSEALMPRSATGTNFKQGNNRPTGDPTELALEGPGFFEVQLPDGSRGYTRNGDFQRNGQGQLLTQQGYAVLGEGGPLQLDPSNTAPLSIAPTGEVSQGVEPKGRIKVAEFADTRQLAAIGNGYFQPRDPMMRPQEATRTSLLQGYLEDSNTSPVLEMANLMSAMRLFEANQRAIQMHDERMAKAISELGNPS